MLKNISKLNTMRILFKNSFLSMMKLKTIVQLLCLIFTKILKSDENECKHVKTFRIRTFMISNISFCFVFQKTAEKLTLQFFLIIKLKKKFKKKMNYSVVIREHSRKQQHTEQR